MIFGRKATINWPELAKQITVFGNQLKGRQIDEYIDDALLYVGEGELSLALDVICAQICEFDVPISEAEYLEATRLLGLVEVEGRDLLLRYMKNLVFG